MFDKYMCYCKTSGGDLQSSIGAADTKIPQLESDIKEGEAKKAQLDEDIKQHQVDRSAAKAAMAEATTLREKEAAAYAKEAAKDAANIAAVAKATTAIEKGMGVAFLSSSSDYAPASGEITGILKTMHDEMEKDIADQDAAEKAAISAYEALMASKTKEVNA